MIKYKPVILNTLFSLGVVSFVFWVVLSFYFWDYNWMALIPSFDSAQRGIGLLFFCSCFLILWVFLIPND